MSTPARESADRYIDRLATACRLKGLVVEIVEPSTRVKIRTPDGPALMDETVALLPDRSAALAWHWSWGTPICAAEDIERAAGAILHVVTGGR